MNSYSIQSTVRAFGPLLIFFALSFLFASFYSARGASLNQVRDVLSAPKASTASNHAITFIATSGMSSGTMVVNLSNVVSDVGSVNFSDVDLSNGGVDQTLAASAAANTWGATITGGVLTLTYPTSCTSPCAAISAGATVSILIGTNASGGDAQMTNASAGSHMASIRTPNDSRVFAIAILANPNITMPEPASATVPSGITAAPAQTSTSTSSSTTPSGTTAEVETAPSTAEIATPPATEQAPPPQKQTSPPPQKQTSPPPTTEQTAQPAQGTVSPTGKETVTGTGEQTKAPEGPAGMEAVTPQPGGEVLAPVQAVATKILGGASSVSLPVGQGAGGAPVFLGVSNPDGSGVKALLSDVKFTSRAGEKVSVKANMTPLSAQDAAFWTGCSNVAGTNLIGGMAYGFSAENTQPKNAGDVAAEAENDVQFTLTYTDKDLEDLGISESSIHPFAFDPENCFQTISTFVLDALNNTVTITIQPKTFFALIGDMLPDAVSPRGIRAVTVDGPKPVFSDISQHDLTIPRAVAENTTIDMCLKPSIFKKPVKNIFLTVGGGEQHRFSYDDARDCFALSLTIPSRRGEQDIELKVIYVDDQVQIIRFKARITDGFQATLLSFALPLLAQVQALNEQVEKTVKQTEPLLQTGAAVAAPVAGLANPALVTNALNWYYYLNHFFSWILSLLGLRKKRKSWGVVYQSITKMPIDLVIVRLFEKATKRLVETQVTDKNGQFSFLAPPGEYVITATKNPLAFPSTLVKGTLDGDYHNIYREEPFTITGPDQTMALSIPLDPPKVEHAVATGGGGVTKRWKAFVAHNPLAPLLGGFIIAELLTLYIPNTLNYTLLGLNGFFIITQLVLGIRPERAWGLIFDALTLEPVPLAAITLFDAKEGKMLRTRLSDYFGRFSFLTPPGEYVLNVAKEGYAFPAPSDLHIRKYHSLYRGGSVTVKGKILKTNIPIVPVEEKPSPEEPPQEILQASIPVAEEHPSAEMSSSSPQPVPTVNTTDLPTEQQTEVKQDREQPAL
ncbi:hypothetical protein HY623_02400 [Candidatus Uhrbacteria bacterium]|nr:hypothetical protein [Candidatus Uhrbacteria bacterium]